MIPQGPDEAAKSAEEEWRNDILVEKAVLRKVTFVILEIFQSWLMHTSYFAVVQAIG